MNLSGNKNKYPLWLYWENKKGTKCPAYIDMCFETVKLHCNSFDIKILNEKTITDYIDVHPNINKVKQIAHKADYFRYKLLYKHGGCWLDSDMIVMKSFDEIVKLLDKHLFLIRGDQHTYSINFLAAKANHPIFEACIKEIEKKLDKKQEFNWSEIGSDLITPIAKLYKIKLFDRKYFAPISWKDYTIFNSNIPDKLDTKDAFTVAISNQIQQLHNQNLVNLTREEILRTDMLIGRLFRKALKLNKDF